MTDFQKYELLKQYLRTLDLTNEQYTEIIKTAAEFLKI